MNINDFKLLMMKGPNATVDIDTDDPDLHALGLPPNTGRYTVASAENGTFSIVATPTNGATAGTSSYEHEASETAAETADALADAINADIEAETAGTLYGFAKRAYYPGSGDAVYVVWDIRKKFIASTVAPGSATLTAANGELWPQAAVIPFDRRMQLGPSTDVEFMAVCFDEDGLPLAASGTFTMEVIEEVPVPNPDTSDPTDIESVCLSRGTLTAAPFREALGVQCNGAHAIGVVLTSISEVSGTDRIGVYYRAVVA